MISLPDGVLTGRFSGQLKPLKLPAVQKTAGDAIDKNGKVRVLGKRTRHIPIEFFAPDEFTKARAWQVAPPERL